MFYVYYINHKLNFREYCRDAYGERLEYLEEDAKSICERYNILPNDCEDNNIKFYFEEVKSEHNS